MFRELRRRFPERGPVLQLWEKKDMIRLLRPNSKSAIIALVAMGAAAAFVAPQARAQVSGVTQVLMEPSPLFSGSSTPGYLGVLVGDVDADSAQKLRLKEVRGAVITLIDHDAPAGQIGLKVSDVVLELNGQPIEGAEQLRRMLHEIPPGRKITLLISRDGAEQTLATQMGDQKKIEKSVWRKMGDSEDIFPPDHANSLLPGGDTNGSTGWHIPFFSSTLHVGAMVEPLTSQMAEYLGVASGLMVKQIARKTEADAAGLKAFDVILKVGGDPIATTADWERALRANQGKPVQLTILRDKKQQTITLQVDSKRKSELEMEDLFPSGDCPLMAELDAQDIAGDARAFAEEMRRQAESLRNSMKDFKVDPKQAEEMRKQAEALRRQLKNGLGEFKITPEQADEMRRQAEALRDSMKDFKIDPKQLDEMKKQMDEFRKNFNSDQFKLDQKQLDELKKQMERWREEFNQESFGLDPQWI